MRSVCTLGEYTNCIAAVLLRLDDRWCIRTVYSLKDIFFSNSQITWHDTTTGHFCLEQVSSLWESSARRILYTLSCTFKSNYSHPHRSISGCGGPSLVQIRSILECGSPLLDYPGRVQSANSSVSFYSDVWGKRSYRGLARNMVKDTLAFLLTT